MSDRSRDDDRPDIVVFPPVLLGGAMALGYLLNRLYPVPLHPPVAYAAGCEKSNREEGSS